jgi:DNA mismatch repair protein MutS
MVAELDVAAALALRARQHGYTRPKITQDSTFHVHQGRHPVLEHGMSTDNRHFRANDCLLDGAQSTWVITGASFLSSRCF